MSGVDFVFRMAGISLSRVVRDKHSVVAELLELMVPLVLFFGLYYFSIFEFPIVMHLSFLLLLVTAMGTGAGLGSLLVNYRHQGFLQEIYSAPLHSGIKILGLMAEPMLISFTRSVIASALILIMGFPVSFPEIAVLCIIPALATFFTGAISIALAPKTRSHNTLTIFMWLIALLQFGLSGLLLSAGKLPAVMFNPYSYFADFLLHASGSAANYALGVDVAVSIALLSAGYALAILTLEKIEV